MAWTTEGAGDPPDASGSVGSVSFQETNFGLVNTDRSSNPPPSAFPVLCASLGSCGNSLASAFYNVIGGARAPVLAEPLLQGTSWSATGGAQNDVSSTNDYLGVESVSVPAFPEPVLAAKIRSQITQAGALGDPYGSGVRTTWWVYGVGPVKIVFQHAGGTSAPITSVMLQTTNQMPQPPPVDASYFPLRVGMKGTYSWTNARYLKKPVVEKYTVDQANRDSQGAERVRSDEGRGRISVHDEARRRHERRKRDQGSIARQASLARPAIRGGVVHVRKKLRA